MKTQKLNSDIEKWQRAELPWRMHSNHVCSSSSVSDLQQRDMHKLRRSTSREQQYNRTLTVARSLPPPPLPRSLSEELSPAQWHVDVYNGDGWRLALPHRGTDGLLPKCLPGLISLCATACRGPVQVPNFNGEIQALFKVNCQTFPAPALKLKEIKTTQIS